VQREKVRHKNCASMDTKNSVEDCHRRPWFENGSDREDLISVFKELNFSPDVDCCASRKNAVCVKFYSKIPQIGSSGVNFLAQELKENVKYFCCPPV
jgi:hypothetical protein